MEIRELLLAEDLDGGTIPVFEKDPAIPVFFLSIDGMEVRQISDPQKDQVVIPLVEEEGRDIDDLVCTVIVTAAMGNNEISATSIEDAFEILSDALKIKDLSLNAVLMNPRVVNQVQASDELRALFGGTKITYHNEIESDVIYGLPGPEFVGRLPYRLKESFGIIIHNPAAIVKARIEIE